MKNHPLSLSALALSLDRPVVFNGIAISSTVSAAINPAPIHIFSIYRFEFSRNIGSTKKGKHSFCSPVEYHLHNALCIVFSREKFQLLRYSLIYHFLLAHYRNTGCLLTLYAYVLLLDLVSFLNVCRYRNPVYAEGVVYPLKYLCYLLSRNRFPVWQ